MTQRGEVVQVKQDEEEEQQQHIQVYKAFDPFTSTNATLVQTIPHLNPLQMNTLNELTDALRQQCNCQPGMILSVSGADHQDDITHILKQYAEDYGHVVHHVPAMVFRPRNTTDVSCLIKQVYSMNLRQRLGQTSLSNEPTIPVRIVTRGSGGNVQGIAQVAETDNELHILLDMANMSTVYAPDDQSLTQPSSSDYVGSPVWADAGCTWLQVLDETEKYFMRPMVLPDYLGITLGGVCSLGGFGGDSIARGSCANNVRMMEVVTGTGDIIICSNQDELFNSVMGGMGQFGVITRLCLNLEQNKPMTRIYHMLSHSLDQVIESAKHIYKEFIIAKKIHTLQIFALPNVPRFIRLFALFGKSEETLEKNVESFSQYQQPFIYMIELTTRYVDESETPSLSCIVGITKHQYGLIYCLNMDTSAWDRRLHLTTIPALTNTGSWFKRHPWLIVFLTEQKAREIPEWLHLLDPMRDMGAGHIGFYPLFLANNETSSFISIPNAGKILNGDEWVYLLVLGRDELSETEEGYQLQVNSNRAIWDRVSDLSSISRHVTEVDLVSASLYPSSIVPGWNEEDWSLHFGAVKWKRFKEAKHLYDPLLVFADLRSFGFKQDA